MATQRSAVAMRIRNVTTGVVSVEIFGAPAASGQPGDIQSFSVPGLDSPSAGASTYVLEVKADVAFAVSWTQGMLQPSELKR